MGHLGAQKRPYPNHLFKYLLSISFMPSRLLETAHQTDSVPVPWTLYYIGRNRLLEKPKTCNIIASYKNTTQENRRGVDIVSNKENLF